jgi:hypothetical protein
MVCGALGLAVDGYDVGRQNGILFYKSLLRMTPHSFCAPPNILSHPVIILITSRTKPSAVSLAKHLATGILHHLRHLFYPSVLISEAVMTIKYATTSGLYRNVIEIFLDYFCIPCCPALRVERAATKSAGNTSLPGRIA